MNEQIETTAVNRGEAVPVQPEGQDYARLAEENKVLAAQLESLRADLHDRTERDRGEQLLEKLVGSRTAPLFEEAVKKACLPELSALSPEKRYEMGYLLCLGEQARAHRPGFVRGEGGDPPPFAYSAGNGQVPLSSMKAPESFAAAKENAKKYFKH